MFSIFEIPVFGMLWFKISSLATNSILCYNKLKDKYLIINYYFHLTERWQWMDYKKHCEFIQSQWELWYVCQTQGIFFQEESCSGKKIQEENNPGILMMLHILTRKMFQALKYLNYSRSRLMWSLWATLKVITLTEW